MNMPTFRFQHAHLLWLAFAAVILLAQPCSAQTGMHSSVPLNGAVGTAPASPPPQGGGGGISGLSERITPYERNAPDREDRTHFNLGTEHVNAVFGGMGQGSGVTLGVSFTTADDIPGVELSTTALVSTKLYRQFEVEAYFREVGSENTRANFRFRYRRRTEDNFFGIGPEISGTEIGAVPGFPGAPIVAPTFSSEAFETNYDLEQRQTLGSLFHDFSEQFQAGVYVDYTSTSTYEGQDDNDPSIGLFFIPAGIPRFFQPPLPGTDIPIARVPVAGLFTGSKILTEGVYA